MAEAGGKLGRRCCPLDQGTVGHHDAGLGVVENVGRLVSLVGGIDRHGNCADAGKAKPAVDELWAVGQKKADPVTVRDTQAPKHSRCLKDPVLKLAVGDALIGNFHEHFVWAPLHGQGQKITQRALPRLALS